MLSVQLRHFDGGLVHVRAFTARDVLAVSRVDTGGAVDLIGRLTTSRAGESVDARALTASDRDRVLAAVWTHWRPSVVQSTITCEGCGEKFDLDFALADLVDAVLAPARPFVGDGFVVDGHHVRLPTFVDEVELVRERASPQSLLDRIAPGLDEALRAAVIERVDTEVSPVSVPIDAACPECGRPHTLGFDLQSWVLGSLIAEQQAVLVDVHLLASTYGWALSEILDLPEPHRRKLSGFIERERVR